MTRDQAFTLLIVIGSATCGAFFPLVGSEKALIGVAIMAATLGLVVVELARMQWSTATSIFALALFTLPWNAVRLTEWMTVSDLLLVSGCGLLILAGHQSAPAVLDRTQPVIIGIAVIAIGGFLGSMTSSHLESGIANLTRFVIAALATTLVIAWWSPTLQTVRVGLWSWVIGAVVSALIGIVQVSQGQHSRAVGLTTHPNSLAITSLMAVGPAVYLLSSATGRLRPIAMASIIVLSVAIVASGSRAGLLGYVAVLVVMTILSRDRVSVVLSSGAVIAATVGTLIVGSGENALSRLVDFNGLSARGSDTARVGLLQDNIALAIAHPVFGTGFDAARDAHNVVLQLIVSAGICGLLGFLYLTIGIVRDALSSISTTPALPSQYRSMMIGLLASFAGYLVAGLFQNMIWDRYVWMVPGLLAVAGARITTAGGIVSSATARSVTLGPRTLTAKPGGDGVAWAREGP